MKIETKKEPTIKITKKRKNRNENENVRSINTP